MGLKSAFKGLNKEFRVNINLQLCKPSTCSQ